MLQFLYLTEMAFTFERTTSARSRERSDDDNDDGQLDQNFLYKARSATIIITNFIKAFSVCVLLSLFCELKNFFRKLSWEIICDSAFFAGCEGGQDSHNDKVGKLPYENIEIV